MTELLQITTRKLTKRDFKKALREAKTTESLMVDSACLTNQFPLYAMQIMESVGEVLAERA